MCWCWNYLRTIQIIGVTRAVTIHIQCPRVISSPFTMNTIRIVNYVVFLDNVLYCNRKAVQTWVLFFFRCIKGFVLKLWANTPGTTVGPDGSVGEERMYVLTMAMVIL